MTDNLPLPEREAIFRQAAALAKLGAYVYDLTADRLVYCSEELARIHALSVPEFLERLGTYGQFFDWIHPDDRARYRAVVEDAIRRGTPYGVEYRLVNARGELLCLHEMAEFLVGDDATAGHVRLVGCIQDITERKRIEEDLRLANETLERRVAERTAELRAAKDAAEAAEREARAVSERFLGAAESLVDGLAIFDAEDRLIYHNSRYPALMPPNLAAALAVGERFGDIVRAALARGPVYHPEMGEDFVERRFAHRRAPATDDEFRLADGRWVRVREGAMADGGRVMLTSDVTERMASRLALQESEERFRTIAEGVPLPIVIARTDEPEVLFANTRAEETFGVRAGMAQPDAIRAVYVRPDDRKDLLARLARDGRVDNLELRLRRADGSAMWALVSARALTHGGKPAMLAAAADISERRAMEEALRASEARLAAFMKNAPVGMHLKGPDGRYILINDEVSKLGGLPAEAVLGRTAADLVPAEHAALVAAYDREVFETGLTTVHEEHVPSVGGHVWLMVIRFPLRDSAGRITHVGGFQVDITERKAIEEALRASEARLAAFMQNAPVGMYVKDCAGRYVLANPEMGKVFGRPAAEALGRTAAELFPPEVAAFVVDYDRELLETGAPSVYEQRFPGQGGYAWSLVIRFPIGDGDGRISHIGGFDVDITERKAIEEALQASEQRFKSFAEAHPVPLIIATVAGARIIYASPPIAELLRRPLEGLVGATTQPLYVDPADRDRLVEEVRRAGRVDAYEVRLRRGDGTEFWAALTTRLLEFEGEAAMVTGIADLTERKRAEAEIERQREALHQSEKLTALGSLLAGVAHELNNPLSVVVAHAAMLRDFATDPAIRQRAGKIQAAAERCARIVRTFLAMARSKPQERGPVRLGDVVEAVLEIVAYGLRSADIEVVRELEPDLPPVWADADQLSQVLLNLVVNAQQALQNAPAPRRLCVATRRSGATAVAVEVADNGPGIEPETAKRIFEPFFTTKPVGVGTGLGLSVCHGIVSAHGGTIEVDSRPGRGARFTVRLPLAGADRRPPAPERAAQAPSSSPQRQRSPARRPGTILVVDDEAEIGEMLAEILEADGHRVEVATSGREALARLGGRDDVDLIISDLRMPDLDGPGLYRELAWTRPELLARVVFLTGDTLGADLAGFLTETGVPIIEKPIDLHDVRRRVQGWLGAGAAASA